MDYAELINSATQSDKKALESLFELAEKLSAEQKYEEASIAFRESAICNAIELHRLNDEVNLIKQWIKANPSGLRPLPRKVEGIVSEKIILEILKNKIWTEHKFHTLVKFLETALHDILGMEFYSPGGSSLRRILHLMNVYFGMSPSNSPDYEIQTYFNQKAAAELEYLEGLPFEVRMYLDLLADEVENLFLASN
jgi:hypothetical protein